MMDVIDITDDNPSTLPSTGTNMVVSQRSTRPIKILPKKNVGQPNAGTPITVPMHSSNIEKECANPECSAPTLISLVPTRPTPQFIHDPTVVPEPILVNGYTTVFEVGGLTAKFDEVNTIKDPDGKIRYKTQKPIYRIVPNTHAHIVNYVIIDAEGETLRKIKQNDPETIKKLLDSQKNSAEHLLEKLIGVKRDDCQVRTAPVQVPKSISRVSNNITVTPPATVTAQIRQTIPVTTPLRQSSPVGAALFQSTPVGTPLLQSTPVTVPLRQSVPVSTPLRQTAPLPVSLRQATSVTTPLRQTTPVTTPLRQTTPVTAPPRQVTPVTPFRPATAVTTTSRHSTPIVTTIRQLNAKMPNVSITSNTASVQSNPNPSSSNSSSQNSEDGTTTKLQRMESEIKELRQQLQLLTDQKRPAEENEAQGEPKKPKNTSPN